MAPHAKTSDPRARTLTLQERLERRAGPGRAHVRAATRQMVATYQAIGIEGWKQIVRTAVKEASDPEVPWAARSAARLFLAQISVPRDIDKFCARNAGEASLAELEAYLDAFETARRIVAPVAKGRLLDDGDLEVTPDVDDAGPGRELELSDVASIDQIRPSPGGGGDPGERGG